MNEAMASRVRSARHMARLVRSVLGFARASGQWGLAAILLLALAAAAVVTVAQVLAPVAIYPFL